MFARIALRILVVASIIGAPLAAQRPPQTGQPVGPVDPRTARTQKPQLHANGLEDLEAITAHLYPALRPTGFEDMERRRVHDNIARRAFELFEARGGEEGRDWEDWFRAEAELHQRG